ncbi:hypothetical protein MOQ_000421 [Trypanosoma cruzi marinkellei]|uniref:Uncharacterized protein n=1 Tax=Trypanosoma cruzi marinkellei TaxID=85056 RepID=K2MVS7_TRYCR|nr:hypothetical protein MOQ_000421 [Trypanosoma cruzi marinkellei]
MQKSRVWGAFSHRTLIFALRRLDVVSATSAHCFHPAWHVVRRGCTTGSEGHPLKSLKDADAAPSKTTTTKISAPASTKSNDINWDDNTVVEGIRSLLTLDLLPRKGSCGERGENTVPLSVLFRSLRPTLRLQLQNSSFGALSKAVKSRPDWFILSADGARVGLTDAAYSYRATNHDANESNKKGIDGLRQDKNSGSNTTAAGDVVKTPRSEKGAITSSKSYVLVRGCFGSTPLDVLKPPLTPAEIEEWKLTRILLPVTLHFLLDKEPITLFPYGEKPRRLSPDLEEAESLYASKGLFPPSEVAAAFVPITPTFFVETRHVLAAMSPEVAQCLETHIPKERFVDFFFRKYPMIFKLKFGKFQKTAVKLNLDFSFIQDYPGCGRADRLLRRYNQEYRATVGGVVSRQVPSPSREPDKQGRSGESHVDVKIFEILLRNLPRFPSDKSLSRAELEERRCAPFPLVKWIDGFPQEDLDVLNSVPQRRVLTLLTRYSHIFQLMCQGEDSNLFAEHMYLKSSRNSNPPRRAQQDDGSNNSFACPLNSSSVCELHELPHANESTVEEEKADKLETDTPPPPDTERKRREANIAAALRDDLIGVDDILSPDAESVPTLTDEGTDTELGDRSNTDEDEAYSAEAEEEGESFDANDVEKEEKEEEEEGEGEENVGGGGGGDEERRNLEERGGDGVKKDPSHMDMLLSTDDESDGPYIPSQYDIIYVRRLPRRIAPRSLSDYNAANSPEPELLQHIASFLNPPPSLREAKQQIMQSNRKAREVPLFTSGSAMGPWRWVPIQRIYASLSKEQKRLLRPFKGLVHFMRLHGEIFELSMDFLHVIAHDPEGQIAPFVPTQLVFHTEDRVLLPQKFDDDEKSKASLIADLERNKFKSILGASQIPTDRPQLLLLDPLNPLLNHEILCEEVSLFMPDHPVTRQQLMNRLPPILKAALSSRHKNNFKTSKHLKVWNEGNRTMLQKSQLAVPESALMGEETIAVEDAIESLREVIPDEGVIIGHLHRMLPYAARKTLSAQFGNVYNAILGYPQYFYIEKVGENRSNSMVFLVERLQEEKQC